MESEYDYYLIGCRTKNVKPLSPWRFRVAYAWYQREADKPFAEILALGLKQRAELVARLDRYKTLAELVLLGYKPAQFIRPPEDDKPDLTPSGDREPRVPNDPVLTGCAARSLPSPNAPDQSFWRV